MKIKILGTGCTRCNSLEKTVREAVKELGYDVGVEHVTDFKKIMEYSLLMTPGLVIDEKVVSSGSVPKKDEIKKMIKTAMEAGK
jgi:small redox-active disulfide protein 2